MGGVRPRPGPQQLRWLSWRAPPGGSPRLDALVGQELCGGKYRVERLIGRGGMGAVYLAEDRFLGRPVALKFLQIEGVPLDESFVRRFLGEARILSQLRDQPGIVELFGAERLTDGTYFFAMEYLQGQSLRERVDAGGAIEPREACRIIADAAATLAAAHGQGILHRDIKPDNVFLCAAGRARVKILDFGLARIDGGGDLAGAHQIFGTPGYMSREALRAQALDGRADVYSLGAVLYYLLSARPIFLLDESGHDPALQISLKVLHDEPRPITDYLPELSPSIAAIVRRAMAPEREQRFATMSELRDALEEMLRATGGAPAARWGSGVWSRRLLLMLFAATVLLLAALFG